LKLVVHGRTDKGLVRKENEDAFCIEKDLGLLAIADGMISHGDRFQGPAGDSGAFRHFIVLTIFSGKERKM
jgi:hypothetical protein